MLCNGIKFAFVFVMGFVVITQAKIYVQITSLEPRRTHVFKGDLIKLKCESSQSQGRAVNVTWHYNSYDTLPAITNSTNSTNIVMWREDNKTISVLTLNVDERSTVAIDTFFIYCTATLNAVPNEERHENKPFRYVPDSYIPKISVNVPQTQAVSDGTRRHLLRCEVSSNVKIDKLSIKWLFGGLKLAEKLIETSDKGKHDLLLQCLTEKDLGNYTCIANTTMYSKVWNDSGVTTLTGKFSENIGMKNVPSLSIYCVIFLLTIWRILYEK